MCAEQLTHDVRHLAHNLLKLWHKTAHLHAVQNPLCSVLRVQLFSIVQWFRSEVFSGTKQYVNENHIPISI